MPDRRFVLPFLLCAGLFLLAGRLPAASAGEPATGFVEVPGAAPAKLLLQFARHDELISPWDAEVYVRAASEPKEVQWYDTDHFFIGNEEARKRRIEWVLKALTPSA